MPTSLPGYTSSVLIVNVWVLAPVGKNTEGGTETLAESFDERATKTPGYGAGEFSASDPMVNEFAQAGFGLNDIDCGPPTGNIIRTAVWLTPLNVTLIFAV